MPDSFEGKLCTNDPVKIRQDGKPADCPPKKGSIHISYTSVIPVPFLPKGNYTVLVEMWATDGERISEFEGTHFVDGYVGTPPNPGECVLQ